MSVTVVRAALRREEALLHEMEDWEEDGRKGRKRRGSMGNQQRCVETRWMDREAGGSPLKPTPTTKSSGKASPGPSRQKPTGVLKRIPTPPRRPSQELSKDMFNPPWRDPVDTDTSSPLGRSSSSRAPVAKGKTAIRSSGSASHTPQRLSSSSEEAEDADDDEFDDEDMEEEEDMEGYEEEDDLSPKARCASNWIAMACRSDPTSRWFLGNCRSLHGSWIQQCGPAGTDNRRRQRRR